MNPVLHQAASSVRLAWISAIMTIVFTLCFVGWTWWAYSAGNRKRFEDAARMPLSDGEDNQ